MLGKRKKPGVAGKKKAADKPLGFADNKEGRPHDGAAFPESNSGVAMRLHRGTGFQPVGAALK
jgi:hypothetical protein